MTTATRSRPRTRQQPVAVVRAHINGLLDGGTTRQAIIANTGVSDRTIRAVLTGNTAHVRAGTATALFTARPTLSAKGLVPAVGTIRCLRALIAFGYTVRQLADDTGLARTGISRLTNRGQQQQVDVGTRIRIVDVYERLSATPGPSDAARRLGRSRGWAVPAAWDNIDNPDEQPCPPAVVDPRTLVNRVLSGGARLDLLTAQQEANLWLRWVQQRTAAGLAMSARQFAIQFNISERRTWRIKAAAECSTQTNPVDSRATERTAV